jgi:transcriptional regulator
VVSHTADGIVASHYPVLLEEDGSDIVLVSHVGRPDERTLELGNGEVMVIIQGPHGYISPSWYTADAFVPTWNHATAHLWGIPELLGEEENLRVLERLVDEFEDFVPEPRSLRMDPELARQVAQGTVGFRLRVTRWDARQKFSQNKAPEVVENIIDQLRSVGPYQNVALADEMQRYFNRA